MRESKEEACVTFATRLDPVLARTLLREAYALEGPVLARMAEALGVAPAVLAAGIVAGMSVDPSVQELRSILLRAAPYVKA